MRIISVESTDLFTGTAQRPLQVIRVTLVNEGPGMLATPRTSATISVQGALRAARSSARSASAT